MKSDLADSWNLFRWDNAPVIVECADNGLKCQLVRALVSIWQSRPFSDNYPAGFLA